MIPVRGRARPAVLVAALALAACTAAPTSAPASAPPSSPARTAAGPAPAETGSPSPPPSSPQAAVPARAQSPGPLPAQHLPSARRDPPGQLHRSLLTFATGRNPKQVAYTPDGRELWVSPLGSRYGVEVYAAGTGRRTARIRLGRHGAVEVIFDRDGRTAYVSQMETASVYAIDTGTRKVRRRYATGGTWTKVMALSPDERTLYAANWVSNDVSAIDLPTGAVRRYPTVRTPRGLFPTPDGKRLYVAGYEHGELQRIDLASGRGRVLLRTGGAMRHLVGDPDRGRLYADDMAEGQIYVLDLATDRARTLARADRNSNTIDLSPDGRVLYVSNRGRNGPNWYKPGPEWGSVVVVDTRTGRLLDAIVAGDQTTGLDVSPDGRRLAYTDFLDDRVAVYDVPSTEALLAGGGGYAGRHREALQK